MNKYYHVFQPLTIRGTTLKNRMHFSPMVPNLASEDGKVTDELTAYVSMQAKTGVGYVTLGDSQIEEASGACFPNQVYVDNDNSIPELRKLAETIHKHGALASIELTHTGAGANPDRISKKPYSPSNVKLDAPWCTDDLKIMDREDMDYIRDKWAECAKRCVDAGFDMVLVHHAHQNLLGQFLSPATNTRTDEYGGSIENRMKFPLEVLKAVREAVGEKTIIELRISAQEEIPHGIMIDDVVEYAKIAQEYADIIEISRGVIFNPKGLILHMPNYLNGKNINVEFAAKVKQAVHIPVSVVGNILTMEDAEEILASGKADIVSMARSLMAEPDLINNAEKNHGEKSRPCLRCMCCLKDRETIPMGCAINPVLGREFEFQNIQKAKNKKKVAVIGGGISGMMAAQNCVNRGHDVVLFEKSDKLGGLLHDASALEFKQLLRNYMNWAVESTLNCGADIRLNTNANLDAIKREAPDVVIIATGSRYINPNIKGIENKNIFMARDVDNGTAKVGEKVIVCGAGLTGIECAAALARAGKKVTLLDQIPVQEFGRDLHPFTHMTIFDEIFHEYNVTLLGNHRIAEFKDQSLLTQTSEGIKEIEADTVVIAMGVKPYNPLQKEIEHFYPLSTYCIGDCSGKGDIYKANHDAFDIALKI